VTYVHMKSNGLYSYVCRLGNLYNFTCTVSIRESIITITTVHVWLCGSGIF